MTQFELKLDYLHSKISADQYTHIFSFDFSTARTIQLYEPFRQQIMTKGVEHIDALIASITPQGGIHLAWSAGMYHAMFENELDAAKFKMLIPPSILVDA